MACTFQCSECAGHFASLRHSGRLYRMSDALADQFARRIRAAREHGMNYREIARDARVSPSTVKRYESLGA